MKKRIISLLMTFCMVFSLMPVSSARADHEEADITGETGQSDGVPVYVYAEAMYNKEPYKGAVEGLKLNNSGWVTIGKLTQQDLPKKQDETTGKWPSYGTDDDQLEAVVKELKTDRFTYHDVGVKGCLDMVSRWTSLAGQYGYHDGYNENNGKHLGYHLDGQIDVYKVTIQYGNGTADDVRYYPKNAIVPRPTPDPTDSSRWFEDWVDKDGNSYDFSTHVTGDVTIKAKWTPEIPVYVYAQTVYNDNGTLTPCTKNVEGVTHNATGYVTLGKMFVPSDKVSLGKSYDAANGQSDQEKIQAIVNELSTDRFVPHDKTAANYLKLVDNWTKLLYQPSSHDGYKGENPGDPNNGSVKAYHLDGVIIVRKVTFRDENGENLDERYYPESNEEMIITVNRPEDPTSDGKWFLGWYTENDTLYDFNTPVGKKDITLTAKWRSKNPDDKPDVSTVMLRVQDVNAKHAHGTADYSLSTADGTRDGPKEVNGVWTYTFTVNTEKFLNRYNTELVNGAPRGTHRLAGTSDLTVTWTWGKNGWVCQDPNLTLNVECPFTVTFAPDNGQAATAQQVYSGERAVMPTNPTRSGYRFDGWYNDSTAYDFTQPVTEDLQLTARWTRRSSDGSDRYTVTVKETENGSVASSHKSAASGTTVTLTAVPDAGYAVGTLTVTVNATGKSVKLTDKGSGRFTFTMPAGDVTVKAVFIKNRSFTDVPDDSYYKDAVDWAVENGITGGVSADAFCPDRICTRAQAVTFLWRAAGSPEPETTEMPFDDVPADSYYFKAVLWAVENGITKGTAETTFSPDMTCSRSHIVTFLWRAAKSPTPGSGNPFIDVPTGVYYTEAVLWAVENGITKGTTDTTYSPAQGCTRAQIITFLYRQYSK